MSKIKWSSYWHFQSSECTYKTLTKIPELELEYFRLDIPIGKKMDNGEWFFFPRSVFDIKDITVEGVHYPFLTIRFWDGDFGCDFYPTTLMLKEIIEIIGTESVRSFWEWHNRYLAKLLSLLGEGENRLTSVYPATYELCKRINFSFDTYYYYKSIVYYCNSFFWKDEYSIDKQIERSKEYSVAFNIFLHTGEQPSEIVGEGFTQLKWLRQITDYSKAKSVLDTYNELLKTALETDKEIGRLINKREKENQEFLKIVKKSKYMDREFPRPFAICQFCGRWIPNVERFPSSCGSVECDRRYQRDKKSRQRGSKNPAGWSCIYQRKSCKGCIRRVQLNEERLCRSCYDLFDRTSV
jgi:hypothetical protein